MWSTPFVGSPKRSVNDDNSARRKQIASLLEQVSLTEVARHRVAGYSGGMQRRLGIAQALLGDPRLIMVDEPTAGLDREERMQFRALRAGLGERRTVILSTHVLDDVAQTCGHVAILAAGRLVYHGRTGGLAEHAAGRTYTATATGAPPRDEHAVVTAEPATTGTTYRIVTDNPPREPRPSSPGSRTVTWH